MAELTEEQLHTLDDEDFEKSQMILDDTVENAEEVIEPVTEGEPEISTGSEENKTQITDEVDSEETDEVEDKDEVNETEEDTLDDIEPEEEATKEESPNDTDDVEAEDESTTNETNYETSFNELMKPIKVSGEEITVKSIDDARNLISMGIDYSRKMRDIKPLRAVGATLAEAGIMKDGQVDEKALMRLVDINNGDKDALAQLMAEKKIDPLDMATEDISYTPTQSMATQSSVEIADVEKELVNRGNIDKVVSELDKMDDASKQFFNETPSNLLMLDDDINSGVYEKIMAAVRYEKTLGRLQGMSDMEAYIQLAKAESSPKEAPIAEAVKPKPSVKKRKAAGISKRPPAKKTVQRTYDYENMSDEDFEKLAPADTMY